MRKIIILTGLLFAGAMLAGTPAKAEIGCACVKLGQAPMCVSTVLQCNVKVGGVCLSACDYQPAKKAMRHHHHHHHAKKKA
ncbi:MAG: hypothetical protein WA792_02345 [Pseudolabrys sp.]|jgi:hypothetical protein